MHSNLLLGLAASLTAVSATVYKGFNYGSTNTDNSPITLNQYQSDFSTAQQLVGTSGFTSARLFTTIQAGTTNSPTQAIQAAINTKTTLLLGLWASAGQAGINNELIALKAAISQYGSSLTNLIVGISVGSEDLYRISPTGVINKSGIGAGPADVSNYINQVKKALAGTAAASKMVGHVDTYTAWINSSNSAVISASDFIGMDAYPYYQNTVANGIENGLSLFSSAYDQTVAVAKGKPVWVTETGWPVSGANQNKAVPNLANAKTYWDQVGCGKLFDKVNTWWFAFQDANPTTPNPSFGVVGRPLSNKPLYDLSCPGSSSKTTLTAPVTHTTPAGPTGSQVKLTTSTTTLTSCSGGCTRSTTVITKSTSTYITVSNTPTTLITKTSTLPSASAGACPAKLSGAYEYPHLIVPVDKSQPKKAGGTSYNGVFSSTVSSIFNFDIPASDAGKTCSAVFLLPQKSQLTTSSYTLSGSGGIDVKLLNSPANQQTSYSTVPGVKKDYGGPANVAPGNSYVIGSFPCPSGQRIGFEVSATGTLNLNYFQDYNPSPIGLYITVC